MRAVVIGGSGHIGSYLVPRLVESGWDVVSVSRGERKPYLPHGSWARVTTVAADRGAEEEAGTFGDRIAALAPDVVIDLICFTEASARHLVEAVGRRVGHLLHCGTIWVHGPAGERPVTESGPRRPVGDYGRQKAAIESFLLRAAHRDGVPATVIHPGHLTGRGWLPINPAGNLNPDVFRALAEGRPLTLPNFGMETLQHVHADDVARLFLAALANRSAAVGESFHAVARTAVTLRGYAEAVAGWSGRTAELSFLPWDDWRTTVSVQDARITHDHLVHSPHCSMEKADRLLGFRPRYTVLEAVAEAIGG